MDWKEAYFKLGRNREFVCKEVIQLLRLAGVSLEHPLSRKIFTFWGIFIGDVRGCALLIEEFKLVLVERFFLAVKIRTEECAESQQDECRSVDISARELLNFLVLLVECRRHSSGTTNFVLFISALLMDVIKFTMEELSTPEAMYQRRSRQDHADAVNDEMNHIFEELILVVRFVTVTLCAGRIIQSAPKVTSLPAWAEITSSSIFTKRWPALRSEFDVRWGGNDEILECVQCKLLMFSAETSYAAPVYFGCGSLRYWGYAYIDVLWNYFCKSRSSNGCTLLANFLITLTRERGLKLGILELELSEAVLQLIYGGLQILAEETVSPLFPACVHVLKALHCICTTNTTTEQFVCAGRVKVITSTLKLLESIMKACNVVPVSCVEFMIRKVESSISISLERALAGDLPTAMT